MIPPKTYEELELFGLGMMATVYHNDTTQHIAALAPDEHSVPAEDDQSLDIGRAEPNVHL